MCTFLFSFCSSLFVLCTDFLSMPIFGRINLYFIVGLGLILEYRNSFATLRVTDEETLVRYLKINKEPIQVHTLKRCRWCLYCASWLNDASVLSTAFTAQINHTNVAVGNQPSVPALSVFGWTIFMQRNGSSFNWALSWASYKTGFGSAGGSDFWLGLERLHLLTSSAKYRLRIELQWIYNGTWSSVEYQSFSIGDEATSQYQLNLGGLASLFNRK